MGIKQISIFVENKVGNLAEVAKVLSDEGISLYSISLADTADFGVLRIIADDTIGAVSTLKDKGYICSMTSVVCAVTSDAPGSLYKILTLFGDNDINLEYLYDVATGVKEKAYLVFKVSDPKKAEAILKSNDVKVLTQDELKFD